MAVLYRRSKAEILAVYTHHAMFAWIVPIYFNPITVKFCEENWVPTWLMLLTMNIGKGLFGQKCEFPIKVTGVIK